MYFTVLSWKVLKYLNYIVGTVFFEEHLDYSVTLFVIVLERYEVSSAVQMLFGYIKSYANRALGDVSLTIRSFLNKKEHI